MAVKTPFSNSEIAELLAPYDLGALLAATPIPQGNVQTNYRLDTSRGRFVLRYYENRSHESALFESDLLRWLAAHAYPCPHQIASTQGSFVHTFREKPYCVLAWIDGLAVEQPSEQQWLQLVLRAAELHTLSRGFSSAYTAERWNYRPALCQQLAHNAATRLGTTEAWEKYAWHRRALAGLELPPELPKGVCHCDFHASNLLFRGEELVAVLDFDDANWTYLVFDLVGLIESRAWHYPAATPDLDRARAVVQAYTHHRPLAPVEQRHLFDVYKLSILFDCVWFFGRGNASECYERRKIDALDRLGREGFAAALFAG